MSEFNVSLFLWLNATAATPAWLLALARFASQELPQWLIAGSFGALIVGDAHVRRTVIRVMLAMLVALVLARLVQHYLPMPRPFALGIGTAWLSHGASAGFPSTHASVAFAFAVVIALSVRRQLDAWIVLALATLIAWSRVFLGLHFPVDVAAGAVIGTASAWLCRRLPLARATQRGMEQRPHDVVPTPGAADCDRQGSGNKAGGANP